LVCEPLVKPHQLDPPLLPFDEPPPQFGVGLQVFGCIPQFKVISPKLYPPELWPPGMVMLLITFGAADPPKAPTELPPAE